MIPPDEGTDKGLQAKVRDGSADMGNGLVVTSISSEVPFFQEMQPIGKEIGKKFPLGANFGDTLGVFQSAAARIVWNCLDAGPR